MHCRTFLSAFLEGLLFKNQYFIQMSDCFILFYFLLKFQCPTFGDGALNSYRDYFNKISQNTVSFIFFELRIFTYNETHINSWKNSKPYSAPGLLNWNWNCRSSMLHGFENCFALIYFCVSWRLFSKTEYFYPNTWLFYFKIETTAKSFIFIKMLMQNGFHWIFLFG